MMLSRALIGMVVALVILPGAAAEAGPPNPPEDLTFEAMNHQGIRLSWANSHDDVEYNVYRNYVQVATVTTTGFVDRDPLPAGVYYVTAVRDEVESEPSNAVFVAHEGNSSGIGGSLTKTIDVSFAYSSSYPPSCWPVLIGPSQDLPFVGVWVDHWCIEQWVPDQP